MKSIKIHGIKIDYFNETKRENEAVVLELLMTKKDDENNFKEDITSGQINLDLTQFLHGSPVFSIDSWGSDLADFFLAKYKSIDCIKVTLDLISAADKHITVEIEKKWHHVFLGLGSNLGNKEDYIQQAISDINADEQCDVVRCSTLIVTKPYGVLDQDDFVNGCLEMRTLYSPATLLEVLHHIEKGAGRIRKKKWGPRTLDLDILFFDDQIIQSPDLIIPHIDMPNRLFVLEPLAEIAPYFIHPVYKKPVITLLRELGKQKY